MSKRKNVKEPTTTESSKKPSSSSSSSSLEPRFQEIFSSSSSSLKQIIPEDEEGEDDYLKISKDDQLRIIEQTGILKNLKGFNKRPSEIVEEKRSGVNKPLLEFSEDELKVQSKKLQSPRKLSDNKGEDCVGSEDEDREGEDQVGDGDEGLDTLPEWVDKAFDTFLYLVPFNTVFVCLDVAIHAQYGQPLTILSELNRLKNVVPTSLVFIHYTLHNKKKPLIQCLMFFISILTGSYMIYVMNKLSYLLVMKRTPGLGCLWIYCVVLMDLKLAVFSLSLVGIWCWIMNLSLYV